MYTIKNYSEVVGQKIRIGNTIWMITKANEYSHTYTFHIRSGNDTNSIEMSRTNLRFAYETSMTQCYTRDDIKTMWAFVRTLHKVVNRLEII